MPQHAALQVKFLGVRGSIPTPLPGHLGYGGNTTCLEVSCADDRLVIDAGSGILTLGPALLAEFGNQDFEVHLLMTHFHWDHIQGLPYFTPLFRNNCRLTFYSGNPPDMARRSLDGQISEPYFPALDSVTAHRQFVQIGKEPFRRGSVMVHPFPLNHPQGAWGYRLEAGAAVIVHASDLIAWPPRTGRRSARLRSERRRTHLRRAVFRSRV